VYKEGWFAPLPPQGEKLPILIGGHSEAALSGLRNMGMSGSRQGLGQRSSSRGRSGSAHARNRRMEVGVRTTLTGNPDAVLAKVKEFEAAGADTSAPTSPSAPRTP